MTVGNIKFVEKSSKSPGTLMKTMTSGRVYAIIDRGEPKSIVISIPTTRETSRLTLKATMA